MAVTFPGLDTYPTNVTAPDDGDAVNGANAQQPSIDLANRTTWLHNRTQKRAAYSIAGGAVSSGSKFTLAELYDATSEFSVASNEVTVPDPGEYKVTVICYVTTASAASGEVGAVARIHTETGLTNNWGTRVAARTQQTQPAGYTCGVGHITISDESTERIEVASAAATGTVTISSESWVYIERVA